MRRIVLVLLVLFIFSAVGFWYWNTKIKKQSFGAQIFQSAQNPIQSKIPETNPLGATKINPFKNIYPNPFDRISK